MINWKVRVKNKNFWIALIPALIVLAQAIGQLFGVQIDLSEINENLLKVVNALFGVLTIIGIVTDPTTKGFGDSERAKGYDEPA